MVGQKTRFKALQVAKNEQGLKRNWLVLLKCSKMSGKVKTTVSIPSSGFSDVPSHPPSSMAGPMLISSNWLGPLHESNFRGPSTSLEALWQHDAELHAGVSLFKPLIHMVWMFGTPIFTWGRHASLVLNPGLSLLPKAGLNSWSLANLAGVRSSAQATFESNLVLPEDLVASSSGIKDHGSNALTSSTVAGAFGEETLEMRVHEADSTDQASGSSADSHGGFTTSFLWPRAKGLNLYAGWAKESCLIPSKCRLLQQLMKRVLQQLMKRDRHMESTICLSYFDLYVWTSCPPEVLISLCLL